MGADSTDPIKIFYCYAREDRALRDELEKHLGALKRSGLISTWYDREIAPGAEWEREIHERLNTADMVLLLISPDFMHSDYCWGFEMRHALARRQSEQIAVLPIIVRSVLWKGTPIAELQLLPSEGKAITKWTDRDAAFEDVANGIYDVVEKIHLQRAEAERQRRLLEEKARQEETERQRQWMERNQRARVEQQKIVQEKQNQPAQAAPENRQSPIILPAPGQSQPVLRSLRLHAAMKTDVGRQLERNEDNACAQVSQDGSSGLFIVADGIGQDVGFEYQENSDYPDMFGYVASRIAVEKVREALQSYLLPISEQPVIRLDVPSDEKTVMLGLEADGRPKSGKGKTKKLPSDRHIEEALKAAVRQANRAILAYDAEHLPARGLGCTITVALIVEKQAYVANLGDSRAYLLRNGKLTPITRDHSLVAKLVETRQIEPEDIYTHPQRSLLYQSLGAGHRTVEPDIFLEQLMPGDRLLLCSDGLWEMVRLSDILKELSAQRNPQQICDALINRANENGGEDNISTVVVMAY